MNRNIQYPKQQDQGPIFARAREIVDQRLQDFSSVLQEQWGEYKERLATVVTYKGILYWIFVVSVALQVATIVVCLKFATSDQSWDAVRDVRLGLALGPPMAIVLVGFLLYLSTSFRYRRSPTLIEARARRKQRLQAAVSFNELVLPTVQSISHANDTEAAGASALALDLIERMQKDIAVNCADLGVSELLTRRDLRDVAGTIFFFSFFYFLALQTATQFLGTPLPTPQPLVQIIAASDRWRALATALDSYWPFEPVLLLGAGVLLYLFFVGTTNLWRRQWREVRDAGGAVTDYKPHLYPTPQWSAILDRHGADQSYGLRSFTIDILDGIKFRGAPPKASSVWDMGYVGHYMSEYWPVAQQLIKGNEALSFPACYQLALRVQQEDERKARGQPSAPATDASQTPHAAGSTTDTAVRTPGAARMRPAAPTRGAENRAHTAKGN